MKKLMLIFSILIIGLGITTGLTMPVYAQATIQEVCNGIGTTVKDGKCDGSSGKSIEQIVSTVIEIFSWVVGVVAVIFAIIAGFKYVTSGGEASAIKSAKDTLLYVVVGLVVAALAQVLVKYVIGKV